MSNSEHMQILQMIDAGQVSVKDAIALMSSTEKPLFPSKSGAAQRWLRVRVTDLATGKRRVSVNLPLGIMRWGLAVGTHFAPELQDVDLDELLSGLDEYAGGRIVEVEDADDNERVEVYID